MNRAKLQQILKQKSQINSSTQCWEWQGQISNTGRGRMMMSQENGKTKMVSAEDASYIAFFAAIPDGHLVRQQCGNRLCVNPEHLELMALK